MDKSINLPLTKSQQLPILKTPTGKIKIRKMDRSRMVVRLLVITLLAITLLALATIETGSMTFDTAIPAFFNNLRRIFLEPRLNDTTFTILLNELIVTLGLAIIATLIGAVLSFFFALLAARNLSNKYVSQFIRALMSFIRAIPAILWVLVFTISIGLGSQAAIVGLMFQGMAFLVKAYSETIEEIDEGVIEALKASGATWWQIVFQAVLPSTLTALLSWTFIRLESNFGHAIAVGAAAGAGGIGFQLFMAGNMRMDMHEVGAIIYFLMAVAIVFELISMQLRKRLLVKS